MFKNFKLLDSNHILHKEGIIINIQTLEFIYPKSTKNIIKFQNEYHHMNSLMLKKFYNIKNIQKHKIIHIDDNIYNNNINNLIYYDIDYKYYNIYLNNDECYYYFTIEKYNLNFDLVDIIPNIKNKNFNKQFILNLFIYSYINDTKNYWKLKINRVYKSEIYNKKLYSQFEHTNYYISNDKSHIVNTIKKKNFTNI